VHRRGERSQSRAFWRGETIKRRCITAAIVLIPASSAHAQVIVTTTPVAPPWNAQQLFEPSPLPDLSSPDLREVLPPEDMPVMKRQQPGYEPVGIRAGSWMLNPSVTAGALYDSNVFSTTSGAKSDIAALIQPTLRAHTLWDRHGLDLQAGVQQYSYLDNSGLDQTNATLKGTGWIDVRHDAQILTAFQVAHLNEGVGTLASPTGAVKPTPYDLFSGDVTYRQEFGRLAASAGTRVDSYSYGSTQAQNGDTIDQSNRDGQIYRLHGRVDYTLSPKLGLFTAFEANRRDLRGTPAQPLDSHGYRVLTGADFELTHLVTAEIAAGYTRQQFSDVNIGTVEGPAYRAIVYWRPTRTVDVTFKAEQVVTETADTTSTGVLADALQLGVDYEMRRNLIFSVYGAYETDHFFNQLRTDRVTTFDAQLKYLLSQLAYLGFEYRFVQRDSDAPLASFDKHQVTINVTAQF
jgi:hypothetical protein